MKPVNAVRIEMLNLSENEALARNIAAAFTAQLDPTVEELTEIKTAVSEAVSNVILHAYNSGEEGWIHICMESTEAGRIVITVEDKGIGIDDVKKAMEPLYTTGDIGERSGMGFTVMESFMDRVIVDSSPGKGTKVTMVKSLDRINGF